MLRARLRKLEEKLKPVEYPEIIVERWIVARLNGLLCYVGKYDRKTGEYFEFNFPITINKMGRKEIKRA